MIKTLLLLTIDAATTTAAGEASSGVFSVRQVDGKWHVIDPAGEKFLMRGINHYGNGSGMPWNRSQAYRSVDRWRASVRDRHRDWEFNYMPPSIGPTALDPGTVEKPHGRDNLIKRWNDWRSNSGRLGRAAAAPTHRGDDSAVQLGRQPVGSPPQIRLENDGS